MDIINELKNFAEKNKAEMSVNVYNGIWEIMEKLDLEEQEGFKWSKREQNKSQKN